jgi:hypothetical protein
MSSSLQLRVHDLCFEEEPADGTEFYVNVDIVAQVLEGRDVVAYSAKTSEGESEGGILDLHQSFTFRAPPGSGLHRSLRSALSSADEEDSDVFFIVYREASEPGGQARVAGSAFLNLQVLALDLTDPSPDLNPNLALSQLQPQPSSSTCRC